jgi:hypothetical protein
VAVSPLFPTSNGLDVDPTASGNCVRMVGNPYLMALRQSCPSLTRWYNSSKFYVSLRMPRASGLAKRARVLIPPATCKNYNYNGAHEQTASGVGPQQPMRAGVTVTHAIEPNHINHWETSG